MNRSSTRIAGRDGVERASVGLAESVCYVKRAKVVSLLRSVMVGAYFVIGGGVWCCEDKDFMEHYVAGDLDSTPYATTSGNDTYITSPKPLHCMIGASGYRGDKGDWPEEGLLCTTCLAFVIKH